MKLDKSIKNKINAGVAVTGFSIFIAQDKISFASKKTCEIFGRTGSELSALTLKDLLSPDDTGFLAECEQVRKGTKQHARGLVTLTGKGGEIKALMQVDSIYGYPSELFGMFVLLDELGGVPLETAGGYLTMLSALFVANMQNPAIILLIDYQNLSIVFANYAAEKFYGYKISELVGMPLSSIDALPPGLLREEVDSAANGTRSYFIERHKSASGVIYDVSVNCSVMRFDGRIYICAIIQDITRRKQLEKIIEEKNVQLAELNATLANRVRMELNDKRRKEQFFVQQSRLNAMGEMIGAVAHQWRQPLNALGLMIQDLDDAYEYGEISKEYIKNLVHDGMAQIGEMSRTIDDFRNFFRSSKEKVMFDLVGAFSEIKSLINAQFAHDNICATVRYAGADGVPAKEPTGEEFKVFGYPNEFKQVIVNIVRNSKHAIDKQRSKDALSKGETGKLDIVLKKEAEQILITVLDNGGGIPQEVISKIFDPYYTTANDGKSLGIGLYMAKAIIETNMAGEIWAENHGDGLMVTIALPLGFQG